MKIKLLIIYTIISLNCIAQYPCFNGISTNPLNPINTQLPSKKNTFFNWQLENWQLKPLTNQGECTRPDSTTSPFFRLDNLEELRDSKDMKWEDGWELISRRVGLNENNLPLLDNDPDIGIILYNKYTGILRVLLKTCRKQDYNAAIVSVSFDATSNMQTDLLEFSTGDINPIMKKFNKTVFAAPVRYSSNNDTKWFYADFPMMYDPCTCNYNSKININSKFVSTGNLNIEGGITGEIHTEEAGSKPQVKKPGTFSWNGISGFVNGKLTAVNSSVNSFVTATQKLATNIGTTDTAGKKDGIAKLGEFLEKNNFLKAGLNSVPWLKSAVGLINVFSSGGNSSAGPQTVKLMPLSVNLTAKLKGTLTIVNPIHDITFPNPGSKDAHLDIANYPYYNEVLGVFNIIDSLVVAKQVTRSIRENDDGNTVSINENRYRFNFSSLKYVLNPAAGVTIQNMKAAIIIGTQNRNLPACENFPLRVLPPDFVYEGKDAISGVDRYTTDYFDIKCLSNRRFQANSFYTSSQGYSPVADVGCANVFSDGKVWIKFMIDLKRNNATPTTQNILLVLTYPAKFIENRRLIETIDDFSCVDSSIADPATDAYVNEQCNSTQYINQRRLRPIVEPNPVDKKLSTKLKISPNPNNGQFSISLDADNNYISYLNIVDNNGRIIISQNEGNKSIINGYKKEIVLNVSDGLYFISVHTKKGVLRNKVVVIN